MPDKLTDKEIVKGLEEWRKEIIADYQRLQLLDAPMDCFEESHADTITKLSNALDLINRLQADCDNYKKIAENQQRVTLNKSFEIKELKAEIERLCNTQMALVNYLDILGVDKTDTSFVQNANELNAQIRKDIKAEAYKEFAERVKMEFYYEFDELIPSIMADKIDNLLKELVGEDK